MIHYDFSDTLSKFRSDKIEKTYARIKEIKKEVFNDTFVKDFLNDYIINYNNRGNIKDIMSKVNEIQGQRAALVVISDSTIIASLKSVIDPLTNNSTDIYYLGDSLSANSLFKVLDQIKDRDLYIYVITDSLLKPHIGAHFRILKQLLEKKYSNSELYKHIIIATANKKEIISDEKLKDYFFIEFDKNIPIEYLCFTEVAYLPYYVAGVEVQKLFEGANKVLEDLEGGEFPEFEDYVTIRWLALQEGIEVENVCTFEPNLSSLCDWRSRLKGNDMLYHGHALYLRDLDNLKYYHDRYKNKIMETFINVRIPTVDIVIRPDKASSIELQKFDNISFNELNNIEFDKIVHQHRNEGMYINIIDCRRLSAVNLGTLLLYFILAGIFVDEFIRRYNEIEK